MPARNQSEPGDDASAQLTDTLSVWTYRSGQPTIFDRLDQPGRVARETYISEDIRELEHYRDQRSRLICGAGMLALGATAIIVGHGNLPVGITGMGMMTLGLMTTFSEPNF